MNIRYLVAGLVAVGIAVHILVLTQFRFEVWPAPVLCLLCVVAYVHARKERNYGVLMYHQIFLLKNLGPSKKCL